MVSIPPTYTPGTHKVWSLCECGGVNRTHYGSGMWWHEKGKVAQGGEGGVRRGNEQRIVGQFQNRDIVPIYLWEGALLGERPHFFFLACACS